MSPLISLIVLIIVVAIVVFLVKMLIDMLPIDGKFKQIINILVMLVAVLIILREALPLIGVNL